MRESGELAEEIVAVGFACTGCGDCCRGAGEDGSLVMVGRDEARRVASAAGIPFAEAVVPFPGEVPVRGLRCRLGWALRRDGAGACSCFDGGRCTVYGARPWICRTYPFMLDGDRLEVSECPGVGRPIYRADARAIAEALLARSAAEEEEADRIRKVVETAGFPDGEVVVIDAEGAWPI